jgi:hypothetical protein
MDEKILERAFGSTRDKWTESQKRVVFNIEWLEQRQSILETTLTLFRKAASDCWLSDHIRND